MTSKGALCTEIKLCTVLIGSVYDLTGSVSRENTPPYRSVSYNPPPGSEAGNKQTVRSASWTSEVPIMPPLSVNVNLGPAMGQFYIVIHSFIAYMGFSFFLGIAIR